MIKIVEEICLGKDKQTKFELDSSISESGTTTPSRHDPSPKNSLFRMKPIKIIEMVRLLEKTCLSVANNVIKG